ncbi:MAG: hypothetical protein MJZ74_05560 [Muribaculaceae bacterium]|nr:hypothetical protein [Muribaculaceae bacterium]
MNNSIKYFVACVMLLSVCCSFAQEKGAVKGGQRVPTDMPSALGNELDLEDLFSFLHKNNCIEISLVGPVDHLVTRSVIIYDESMFSPAENYDRCFLYSQRMSSRFFVQIVNSALYNKIVSDIKTTATQVPENTTEPKTGTYRIRYNGIENSVENEITFCLSPDMPESVTFFEKQLDNAKSYPELIKRLNECLKESQRYVDEK